MAKQNQQKQMSERKTAGGKAERNRKISRWGFRVAILGAVLVILGVAGIILVNRSSTTNAAAGSSSEPVYVAIEVRDYGTITAELYPDVAPVTVANFVKLVKEGFYDGLTFHRVITGFMIQGGDPKGNGTGGSNETIKGEFSANGVTNSLSHTRGVLSMARSSAYDSASSQFFIMQKDGTYLDGQYAAFGKVLSGMEVVDAICRDTPVTDSNGTVAADDQPVITSIRVIDKPE